MEKVMLKDHERVTTYSVKGHKYEIVKSDVPEFGVRYFAINYDYLDNAYRLTKELNGLDMFMSESMEELLNRINRDALLDNFAKKNHCSKFVAQLNMNGMPMKQARELEKVVLNH